MFTPSRLGGLGSELGPFPRDELGGAGFAALKPPKPAQGDRSGVLGGFWLVLELWRLPSRFEHDLVGGLVEVATTAFRHALSIAQAVQKR